MTTTENNFTLITGIDAFGDGTTLIYRGDELLSSLESDESSIGYVQALEDLDHTHQSIDIEFDDWEVGEEWGSNAPKESLTELLAAAETANAEVTVRPGQ